MSDSSTLFPMSELGWLSAGWLRRPRGGNRTSTPATFIGRMGPWADWQLSFKRVTIEAVLLPAAADPAICHAITKQTFPGQ